MVKALVRVLLFMLALPAMAAQDFFIEAELEPAEVHVNAQAVYRLRVYQAVDVSDLHITGPSARLADFRAIGEGRVFETRRDGRQYRVHERGYAVFPFASGTLTLAGAHATGRVVSPKATTADRRIDVRLDAPPRDLTVLPIDVQADGAAWVPADTLALTESWSAAGATQRRTIRIEATGVDAAQLPALQVAVDGMSVHAEAARLENRFAGEKNVAIREQTFVMTPTRSGRIQVPPLQLPWWQDAFDSPALATLPGRTLDYGAPSEGVAAQAFAVPVLAAALAVLLAAICLLAWRRRDALRDASDLRRACRDGDLRGVRDGLLRWGARIRPQTPPKTLAELAGQLRDPGARRALGAIDRALYGPDAPGFTPASLQAAVLAVKRDGR